MKPLYEKVATLVFTAVLILFSAQEIHAELSETDQFRRTFFETYIRFEPEDGTSLGYHAADGRLKDTSPEAVEEEIAFYRWVMGELEEIGRSIPADEDLAIDLQVIRSISGYKLHYYTHDHLNLWNIWLSSYPYKVISNQATRATRLADWENIESRLRQIPVYLVTQQNNLQLGKAARIVPNAYAFEQTLEVLKKVIPGDRDPRNKPFFCGQLIDIAKQRLVNPKGERSITNLLRSLAASCDDARRAYKAHLLWLEKNLGVESRSNKVVALGKEEYQRRLREVFFIHESPEELVAKAEKELHFIHKSLESKIGEVVGRRIEGLKAVTEEVRKMRREQRRVPNVSQVKLYGGKAEWKTSVLKYYSELAAKAANFVRDHRLFDVRKSYNLDVLEMPTGVLGKPPASNWPAYLMDPTSKGYFIVNLTRPIPEKQAAVLTVHEAIPGHYLQSLEWQQRFRSGNYPIRFFQIDDEANAVSGYWGPMLNVEGFAHYAERLMLDEGFFNDPYEEIEALVAQALRAVRVIVDCNLHAFGMGIEDAANYLYMNGLDSNSREEALRDVKERYALYPTQAITYMIGRLQIESLRTDWIDRNPRLPLSAFHTEFLSYGPVPPEIIRTRIISVSK